MRSGTLSKSCGAVSLALIAYTATLATPVSAATGGWTSLGLSAGSVRSLAHDPASSAVFAGTYGGGVFKSTDGGASWSSIAREIRGQTVDTVATGGPRIVFAGTHDDGVWRSRDGGATWKRVLFGGAQAADRHAAFQSIAVDPTNPRIVVAATDAGFNAGVWRSTDGGDTWKHSVAGLPNNFRLSAIAVDPKRPGTVYLGTLSDGAYRSTDGGATWSLAGESLRSAAVLSFAFDPSTAGTMYAGTMGSGLHKSTDGGATWTAFATKPIASTRVHSIAIDPGNPAVIWAGVPNALLRTTDGGRTWVDTMPFLDYVAVRAVLLDPAKPSSVLAGTTRDGVLRSEDGGRSWFGQHTGLFALDVTGIATDPTTPKSAWLSTSTGVWRTSDDGATWMLRSDGLTHRGANCIVHHPVTRELYACTGDGVFRSADGGQKWTRYESGLGVSTRIIGIAFDASNPSLVYARDPHWGFASTDGGKLWKRMGDIGAEGVLNGLFALATMPGKPGVLVASNYRNVMKSVDGGATFAKSNSGLPLSRVQTVVADASGSTLWAGTEDQGVWRSADGGATWTESRAGMGAVNAQALLIDPAQPGTLYAAVWKRGVYRSSDGGRNWKLVAGSPPHPDVIALALDPAHPGSLLVGTGGGGAWRVDASTR